MPLKFKIYSITNYSYDKVFSLVYSNSLIQCQFSEWEILDIHVHALHLASRSTSCITITSFKTKQIITLPYRSFVWIPALMYWFQTHHTAVEEHADQSHWSLHKRKWHHGSLQSHLVGGVFLTSSTTLSVVMLARS